MSILISALLLVGIEIRQVIGLTFVITLLNSLTSIGPYWKHERLDWRVGVWMGVPATCAVIGGGFASGLVNPDWLTMLMTVCLLMIGVKFVRSTGESLETTSEGEQNNSAHPIWLMLMGIAAGFTMGVMGGGGAVFISIALILLFKIESKTAIGTSILIMGLAAIPGAITHWARGSVDIGCALVIGGASIPAASIASAFANRVSSQLVKRLLGVYLIVIAIVLLVRTFLERSSI